MSGGQARPRDQAATRAPPQTRAARERVLSGIQPSGASHLGNYLGAQVNYVALQDQFDAIYAIVDFHALTTVHDGALLRKLTHEMVLDLLAVGLDPKKCALIRQSDLPEHAELSWILDRKSTRLNSSHRTISYAVFC